MLVLVLLVLPALLVLLVLPVLLVLLVLPMLLVQLWRPAAANAATAAAGGKFLLLVLPSLPLRPPRAAGAAGCTGAPHSAPQRHAAHAVLQLGRCGAQPRLVLHYTHTHDHGDSHSPMCVHAPHTARRTHGFWRGAPPM